MVNHVLLEWDRILWIITIDFIFGIPTAPIFRAVRFSRLASSFRFLFTSIYTNQCQKTRDTPTISLPGCIALGASSYIGNYLISNQYISNVKKLAASSFESIISFITGISKCKQEQRRRWHVVGLGLSVILQVITTLMLLGSKFDTTSTKNPAPRYSTQFGHFELSTFFH